MIFTFYSYKGGVGRSMALANVAQWYYQNGLRVAVVDWDLEAPGIESFFFEKPDDLEAVRARVGVVDMLTAYKRIFTGVTALAATGSPATAGPLVAAAAPRAYRDTLKAALPSLEAFLYPVRAPGGGANPPGGAIWLLTAGLRAGDSFESYGQQVQSFDWAEFYSAYEGEAYFDWLRDELLRIADVVLIDSRTGVTEMGGVCARQLADAVVSFVAPNFQNLVGVKAMVASFRQKEVLETRGRDLRSVIVPARMDLRSEIDLQNEFEAKFRDMLRDEPNVFRTLNRSSWDLKIPYISKYAYKEKLAVGQTDRSEELEKAYTELALHLATLAEDGSPLRVKLASHLRARFPGLLPAVFVTSAQRDGKELVERIQQRLAAEKIGVARADDLAPGGLVQETLTRVLDHTRHFIVALTPAVLESSWIRSEVYAARARGIPVYLVTTRSQPVAVDQLPGWLRGQQPFDIDIDTERLASLLKSSTLAVRVPYMVPATPPSFVPRVLQHKLRQMLLEHAPEDVNVALTGPPGTGKSALAIGALADDEVAGRFRGGVVWLDFQPGGDAHESAGHALRELARACEALTGEPAAFQSDLDGASRLATLAAERECLVVLDNATPTAAVERLLTTGKRYPRLITSRDLRVSRMGDSDMFTVGNLEEEEARELLLLSVKTGPSDVRVVEPLIRRLERNPLLVTWANSELRNHPDLLVSWNVASMLVNADAPAAWVDAVIDQHRGQLSAVLSPSLNELTAATQERYRALALLSDEDVASLAPVASPGSMTPRADIETTLPPPLLNKLRVTNTQELGDFVRDLLARGLLVRDPLAGRLSVPTLAKVFFAPPARTASSTAAADSREAEPDRSATDQARRILRGQAASVAEHLTLARALKRQKQFTYARRLLGLARAHEGFGREPEEQRRTIIQQLALCTYKDDDLPLEARLIQAFEVLSSLGDLAAATDQETLGIAGGIFKRRWEQDGNRAALERSLGYYLRGYQVGRADSASFDNGYTGINAAFVLDLLSVEEQRAARDLGVTSESGAARRAQADRIRRDLLAALPPIAERPERASLRTDWWFLVTLGEAAFGLGEYKEASRWLEQASALPVADWEFETTARQLARIAQLRGEMVPGGEALAVLRAFLKGSADAVISAQEGRVGLALSGGGFRASLFHIGVLARLADADLLRHVEVLSCVSGGLIIGAHYYLALKQLLEQTPDNEITRDDFIHLVGRVEKGFLLGVQTNIRVQMLADPVAAARTAFTGVYSRSERVGQLYEEKIFSNVQDGHEGPRYVNDLLITPKGAAAGFSPKLHNWGRSVKVPMLVINAATLNTGHAWQFTASWMGEPPASIDTAIDTNDRLRRMYYLEAPPAFRRVRLGLAVASSSCVPGLFDPVVLEGLYPDRTIRLVDGGVCDNQGVSALLEQDCSVLIVSDASGQMRSEANPAAGTLGVFWRSSGISQERVRLAEYQDLLARKRLSRVRGLVFVHLRKDLDSEPVDWVDCQDPLVDGGARRTTVTSYGIRKDIQAQLAALRTDLDSFSDIEAFALMTSGYRMMDVELRASTNQLAVSTAQPTPWRFLQIEKDLQAQDVGHVKRVLEVGSRLGLKAWALVPSLRYATVLAMIGALALVPVLGRVPFVQGLPTLTIAAIEVAMVVLFVLGLITFNKARIVIGRLVKGLALVLFSLFATAYLWFIDRRFLNAGAFRIEPAPGPPSTDAKQSTQPTIVR